MLLTSHNVDQGKMNKNELDIAVVKSSFENLEKLNDRIYFEAEREGYHHLTTETKDGIQQSLYVFKNLKNKEIIESLLKGYEYLNEADIYFGKIDKINEYIAIEYSGMPTRITLSVDNGETYDIPQGAKEHLNIEL
jgi:hypothetical protein